MSDTCISECVSTLNLSAYENEDSFIDAEAEQTNLSVEEDDDTVEDEEDINELLEIEENAKSLNEKLAERVKMLQDTMSQLKSQLQEEKEKWKKEVEELSKMTTNNGSSTALEVYENEEVTESVTSTENDQDNAYINMDNCKEYSIVEYEQKLARYQEALAKAQAEKRATLKRQIAISNYKRRLLEVENMCNLELLRVKQNVQFLQPLQMMASEWNKEKEIQDHGDDGVLQSPRKEIEETKDRGDIHKSKELLPIENIGNKLFNDMNEMFSKIPSYSRNMPPSSTYWQPDDEPAVRKSNVWYPM